MSTGAPGGSGAVGGSGGSGAVGGSGGSGAVGGMGGSGAVGGTGGSGAVGGMGGTGAGGAPNCCPDVACGAGDECVKGNCLPSLKYSFACWQQSDCGPGATCENAFVCQCPSACTRQPGKCVPSACCQTASDCGGFAAMECVNHVCKLPPQQPGKCWTSSDCTGSAICVGATVCPCGSACIAPDQTGTCSMPP